MGEVGLSAMGTVSLAATVAALRKSNELSERYGLTLSESAMGMLAQGRLEALRDTGRVEVGSGVLPQIIQAFCDSPYLTQEMYAAALATLQEAFYYFKQESEEAIADDELIQAMADTFNGCAQGSLEYMAELTWGELCRAARGG